MDNNEHIFPAPKKNLYDLNNKIMLTAIILLSVVVVIVTLLHIYARFVLRRQARRRATMLQLRLAVSQAQHSTTEPPMSGLNPTIIASLPLFIFKRTVCNDDTSTGTTECAVCLSFLEDNEMARILPNCKHTFHAECIDKWLSSQSTCPICRTEANPHHLPQPCEVVVGGALPTAPPMEHVNSELTTMEGTSVEMQITQSSEKIGSESNSRLSSFRRMLSREKLSWRIQSCDQEDGQEDVEAVNFR